MSNIRSLFFACHVVDDKSGVGKKVKAQVDALQRAGFDVALSHLALDDQGEYCGRLIEGIVVDEYSDSFVVRKKWKWRFKFDSVLHYISSEKIQFLYIRYTHFANPLFVEFLNSVKKLGVVVFLEIPTYPYDDEYRDASKFVKASLWFENFSRQSFANCVDRILTYSDDDSIFGVKTLQIDNGVDLLTTPLRKPSSKQGKFSILAVSSMEYWHGYDRLISGLRKYYDSHGEVEITINFAGGINTPTAKKYIEQVASLKLAEHVNFLGYVSGEMLNQLFDETDVAVGVLGGHRKSLDSFKSLKNREYCARGVPFAYSGSDATFDGQEFALKFPANDSPIDIKFLMAWSGDAARHLQSMRMFAEANISWDTQMKLVGAEYSHFGGLLK